MEITKLPSMITLWLLICINGWYLIIVCAYSAAHNLPHLSSYVTVTRKFLNNGRSNSEYLWQLVKIICTVPLMILLIVCEFVALFIETFNLVRQKPRVTRERGQQIK